MGPLGGESLSCRPVLSPADAGLTWLSARETDAATTYAELCDFYAAHDPRRLSLQFEGRSTTYADLVRVTDAVARALAASGCRRGDRIAYLGKNSDRYFVLALGAGKCGVVTAPINWRSSAVEVGAILDDAGANLLFCDPEFLPRVQGRQGLRVILLEQGTNDRAGFDAWCRSGEGLPLPSRSQATDPFVQLYTSGTTGRPKGVVLSQANLLAHRPRGGTWIESWRTWTDTDVSLVAMPVFHVGGSNWGFAALANGARAFIEREFDPRKVLDTVERHGITKLFLVPSAIQIVVREFQRRPIDFSGVRYLLYGASPIPLELMLETMQTLRCQLVQLYGMTETAGTVVALPPHAHHGSGAERLRSAGRPLPGVEVAIVDAEGRHVQPRTPGEILIRSPSNMLGYWQREDETRATLGADGWLRTGDAGFLDEEGYLTIQDRLKDMIISGGENVFPAEVENAILGHPDVAEVAVIGVPDAQWGEAVLACVVARPGADHDAGSILAWARERIAGFKVPKAVQFVEALPRNAAGKVLKRELRHPFWEGRNRAVN